MRSSLREMSRSALLFDDSALGDFVLGFFFFSFFSFCVFFYSMLSRVAPPFLLRGLDGA